MRFCIQSVVENWEYNSFYGDLLCVCVCFFMIIFALVGFFVMHPCRRRRLSIRISHKIDNIDNKYFPRSIIITFKKNWKNKKRNAAKYIEFFSFNKNAHAFSPSSCRFSFLFSSDFFFLLFSFIFHQFPDFVNSVEAFIIFIFVHIYEIDALLNDKNLLLNVEWERNSESSFAWSDEKLMII